MATTNKANVIIEGTAPVANTNSENNPVRETTVPESAEIKYLTFDKQQIAVNDNTIAVTLMLAEMLGTNSKFSPAACDTIKTVLANFVIADTYGDTASQFNAYKALIGSEAGVDALSKASREAREKRDALQTQCDKLEVEIKTAFTSAKTMDEMVAVMAIRDKHTALEAELKAAVQTANEAFSAFQAVDPATAKAQYNAYNNEASSLRTKANKALIDLIKNNRGYMRAAIVPLMTEAQKKEYTEITGTYTGILENMNKLRAAQETAAKIAAGLITEGKAPEAPQTAEAAPETEAAPEAETTE